jgi:hypothetical protein
MLFLLLIGLMIINISTTKLLKEKRGISYTWSKKCLAKDWNSGKGSPVRKGSDAKEFQSV